MKKNGNRILKTKGVVLDNEQLQKYMEKIAHNQSIKPYSTKDTYPITRLNENFKFIEKTYILLSNHIKKGINIHPAGEWLLDNFYLIEETVKRINKEMNLKKYLRLPCVSEGLNKGFSRIYVIASEIIAYTDCKIDDEVLNLVLSAYQKRKNLSMEEIWDLWIFLEISIIENIRDICEQIYSCQMQKYKVENIVERLIDKKENREQKFKIIKNSYNIKDSNKFPFIEYMSYKLKKYGKNGIAYLNILEEEVNKLDLTISEIIEKEHSLVATYKVLMGNCINSIREILGINFTDLFENINGVEEILKKDPAKVYEKMDYRTKEVYRNKINELGKRTRLAESYIAKVALNLAKQKEKDEGKESKKSHIGYYLIQDGINDLRKVLDFKKEKTKERKENEYIFSNYIVPILLSIIVSILLYKKTNLLTSLIGFVLLLIPLSEIYIQTLNYILSKKVKPVILPKLDLYKGVPKEYSTIVAIPTIIGNTDKVIEIFKKLEVYYLANKSENIYFALLGDCTSSKNEEEKFDKDIEKVGIKESERLNKKYCNNGEKKFFFFYRKRIWNSGEECYLGWERKRGLLLEFNNFLINKENNFRTNTMIDSLEQEMMSEIKYVITLDADTNLTLNSAFELIGTMAHILNKPVIDRRKNIVIEGHGIIQPRVGVDLDSSRKSFFTKVFATSGGTDSYTNAISDIYQDNFEEGIFTGKGIYDLKVFNEVLAKEIPENTVLSHDLLEGSYLRCGLATDILLIDGYPFKYNSYISRIERWTRGDWQLLQWIERRIKIKDGTIKINPLDNLSKFKILDNLRRSLVPVLSFLLLSFAILLKILDINGSIILSSIATIAIFMPTILDLINLIVYRKNIDPNFISAHKNIVKAIGGIKASILRSIFSFSFLPYQSYINVVAVIKTIYRLKYSKKHLLEWMTSEEAEKQSKTDLISYYRSMSINVITSIFLIAVFVLRNNILSVLLGIWFLVGPFLAWYISKEKETEGKDLGKVLNDEDTNYLLDIAKRTWQFFKDNLKEENNYLPIDNYQEDRKEKLAKRTSPTNIGLALLSIVSACDLKFISIEEALNLIDNMLNTISKMQKWNGHLYNWYNITTLEPLFPRYVSTVDSGNFVGYLYTLKQFLTSKNQEKMIEVVDNLIKNTDFKFLYDYKKRLFSIGFNVEENKQTKSYYDLLASEARQASIVAIAKKDIDAKHWNSLSRTLTTLNRYKGLISWSGTAFEYLMPTANIKQYEGSLLDESCRFMIMSQKEYAKKLGIPWGISEAAFNLKDLNNNYQYKAFGIPWLGLKRGLEEDMVVSPYSVFLSLRYNPKEAIENLRQIQSQDMYNQYGFYESLDYTMDRLEYGKINEPVKTYMAHHQGLILLSINNLLNNDILIKRFNLNPEIQAIDILLQERMPDKAIITKERKEKVEKVKIKDYESYTNRVYTKIDDRLVNSNVISNGKYTVCMKLTGEGFSKCNNLLINRYKETADYFQGNFFCIKNLNTNNIWYTFPNKNEKKRITFEPSLIKYYKTNENIEQTEEITVAPNDNVEIRRLTLKNIGTNFETLEVINYFEPVLSTPAQDYAHMAFNNLFLSFERLESGAILIKRKKRGNNQKEVFAGVSLYTEFDSIGDLEYEIDKEKFIGKGNLGIPEAIKDSKPLSNNTGLVTDPILALKKTIKIGPGEEIDLNLIICMDYSKEKIVELLNKYENNNEITKTFELAKAKVEAENIYLGIKGKEIEIYQKILGYLIMQNPTKSLRAKDMIDFRKVYSQSELWKYGISGDLPILLVRIKDINDVYIIEDLLKAYEFFRAKNIKIDLVILNEEVNTYNNYVAYEVENAIQNRQLSYLKNTFGGIYIINSRDISNNDRELLDFRANLVIDASLGSIESELKDLEEEYLEENKYNEDEIYNLKEEGKLKEDYSDLAYFNEYGGFNKDGKEFKIRLDKNNKLPTVWSMILANPNFGTVITQNLGGFTWNKNSRLNRISTWQNSPTIDIPSEVIFVKNKETKELWSLSENLNKTNQEFSISYEFGYVKLKTLSDGIMHELETFIPLNDKIKVNILTLRNMSADTKKLELIYYINPTLGEEDSQSFGYIDVEKEFNIVLAKNLYTNDFKNEISYITSSENITEYTGDKNSIIKNMNVINTELNNKTGLCKMPCIAIKVELEIKPFETKELSINLGQEDNILDVKERAYKYGNILSCKEELKKTKNFWEEKLTKVQVKTPLESMNIMLNGWAAYQTIVSRLWSKTGYYQSGGATGFRDQLQDTLGIKYIDEELMKNQILKHAMHQFIEGDVEHWWHEETSKGIRTRFSDDLLWLCYVVYEYVAYTGDYEILEEKIPYLTGDILEDGVDEKYDTYITSNIEETLYMHCIRAIEKSLEFGENGLPKIGSGDWNDGLNTVGNKQKGESVWLGFFIYEVLTRFIKICEFKKDFDRKNRYEEIKEKLKKALNIAGWDGRWFRRAYNDNGEPIGSIENEECRIDSVSQSWGVISEAADNDKKYISMESLENHLIDKENGIIKLLDPPFNKTKMEPGYIKSYLPGVRENGGQYTHAAIWVIYAFCKLGFGDKALELYKMINPIEHARTKEAATKYKVEPYVIPADIYGAENLIGRGGWTWYTGSSSWFLKVGIENILGLNIEGGVLKINPCIPKDWKEYIIRYRYKNSMYNITVKNPNEKNTGVTIFKLNGQEIKEKQINLKDDGKVNEIEIIM